MGACAGVGGSRVALLDVRVSTLASSWGKMGLPIFSQIAGIGHCQQGTRALGDNEGLTRRGLGGWCSWLMMLVLLVSVMFYGRG